MNQKIFVKENIYLSVYFNSKLFFIIILDIILLIISVLFYNCSDKEKLDNYNKPYLETFSLLQINNPSLKDDIIYQINSTDSLIQIFAYDLNRSDSIIPSFIGNYASIKVNKEEQISGKTVVNFDKKIRYELIDEKGCTSSYDVILKVLNGIPRIDITTENKVSILSKEEYIKATIKISNCPEYGELFSTGKIKGRGNATWWYEKKPYQLKFDTKQSPFNFPENKTWILLADFHDKTLMRTAYMCEVSKAAGIEYTVNYKHVDLYINDNYNGTYLLTDKVEKGNNRIKVNDDGYLIENDGYYQQEPLYFLTDSFNYGYSFKYPDPDDGEISFNDDNFSFIVRFMNELEQELLKLKEIDNDEFINKIDLESFAKWYITAELTATRDPNFYYVLTSKNSKLKMMPIWDAEWSLGLWPTFAGHDPYLEMKDIAYWKNGKYFSCLFNNKTFIKVLQSEWNKFKGNTSEIKDNINKTIELIRYSQEDDFKIWSNTRNQYKLNLSFEQWEENIKYINAFFDDRVIWMDSYIMNLNR